MTRIWLGLVLLAGIYINLFGLWLYRKPGEVTKWPALSRWVTQFQFSPETLGGFSYSRLALISLFGLFLELLMIRWISSEIAIFAYFKNFVLVACYLGFGLGCYLSRRPINLLALCVPLIALALLCEYPSAELRNVVPLVTEMVGSVSQVNYGGVPSLPLNTQNVVAALSASFFVVCIFGAIALVFIPVGQLVGWLLEHASDGIFGYTDQYFGQSGRNCSVYPAVLRVSATCNLVRSGWSGGWVFVLETAETAMDRSGDIFSWRCADQSSRRTGHQRLLVSLPETDCAVQCVTPAK